ncbi:MAG: hypothetical protein M1161_05265 [Candidatus Thermoplasmatota archaeon]|nr:hypothetical protein [Candidatus Thermoplasmatota archaeon]
MLLILLVILSYTAFKDVRTRKADTLPYLEMDILLVFFFVSSTWYIALFMVPVLLEFYPFKKRWKSYPAYALVYFPVRQAFLLHPPNGSTFFSVFFYAVTLLAVKGGCALANTGLGDLIGLETVVMALPATFSSFISNALPTGFSFLFLLGAAYSVAVLSMWQEFRFVTGWPDNVPLSLISDKDRYKYRVNGRTGSYTIPFALCIAVAYVMILLLMYL